MKEFYIIAAAIAITALVGGCTADAIDSTLNVFKGAVSGYENRRATPAPVYYPTYPQPGSYPVPYQPTYH